MNQSDQVQYILRTAMSTVATAEAKILDITALHAQSKDPQTDMNACGELIRTIIALGRNLGDQITAVRGTMGLDDAPESTNE